VVKLLPEALLGFQKEVTSFKFCSLNNADVIYSFSNYQNVLGRFSLTKEEDHGHPDILQEETLKERFLIIVGNVHF